MNNSWWRDFKLKFFGSGTIVLLPYIAINIFLFIIVALFTTIGSYSGIQNGVYGFVSKYLLFSVNISSWPTHFYMLITYQFFHFDFFHILFNMLWLYWMGQLFMDFFKPRQFHFIYLLGGVFGALFFTLCCYILPSYSEMRTVGKLFGASASVMAIFAAITTLIPNYSLNLIFIGPIRIKYLLAIYLFLDLVTIKNYDGGSLAHIGGTLFGFIYVKLLQNGIDMSTLFKNKPKLKVVKNQTPKKSMPTYDQKEIDTILDKISKSGYDKLTKEEKETLFKASEQ